MLQLIGSTTRQFVENVVDINYFIATVLRRGFSYLHRNQGYGVLKIAVVREIIFDGVDTLINTILLLSLVLGMTVTAQLIIFLQNMGAETEVVNILIRYIAFELSPLLTAIIIICRSGSAMAIQTGNMSINQEIKSLEMLGVDVLVFFAFPSLIGKTISQVSLSCYLSALTITFGILFSSVLGSAANFKYFITLINSIDSMELIFFLIKNIIFGMIISANACFHGLHVKDSVTEIPQRVQKAIMHSIFAVLAISVLFIL